MAEAAKVRLVRCPKCENLLPELPNFSLYQCGGCGAVLEAKQKGVVEDGLSDISDDVPSGEISEEGNIVEASQVKMGKADKFEARILEEEARKEGVTCNGGSPSQAGSIEAQYDSTLIRRGKQRIRNFQSHHNNYTPYSQDRSNVYGPGYARFPNEYVSDHRTPMEPLRPRLPVDQWGVRNVARGHGPERGDSAQMRFGDLRYFDEGQSSYETDSHYQRGERTSSYPGPSPNEPARTEDLENGRAELIRRLDELKDQISRSCDVSDKFNEIIGIDRPDPYGSRQSASSYQGNLNNRPLKPDNMGPLYIPNPTGYIPYKANMCGSHPLGPYPERRYPQEIMHYPDTYKPEILHRPPHGPQSQYAQHRPYHGPGYYGEVNNQDLFMINRHENFFHQPACLCTHCYDKTWPGPQKVDRPGPHNPRFHNGQSNYPNHRPLVDTHTRGSNLRSHGPQKSSPFNSNVDSENDGFNCHRPRKIVVTHKNGRALAGGAPFIGCSNCFEVLKIPRRCVSLGENQQKLKCGACSSIIVFKLGEKGFVASASVHIDQILTEMDEGSSGTLDENMRYSNGESNCVNLNPCSNEYENFQDQLLPDHKKSNPLVPNMQLDQLLSASSLSEDGESPKNEEGVLTEVKSSPDQDLPHDQNIGVDRFDQRNKSQRPKQEKVSIECVTSQQKSAEDVSINEFSNSCASQDSVETSKETRAMGNKGSDSFFTGLIKKTFKDFKRPNQGMETGEAQVFVNGHFIPNRVVKRAEKLAGPIQPGEYWYDKRAGFWGVMGHPCLGIIMPNIQEFDYPMASNCAAGNTGVSVNGRELHQKDLDLLAGRGLPVTKNKSYLVEITGSVTDEQTGEELASLGKLAPTVEKAKHGFGMKVPRFIAQSKN